MAEPSGAARATARWGVLGGTFDPPHLGHLILAEVARVQLRLEGVLFVPSARPPHKRGVRTPLTARVAMTRLAIRGNPSFRLSTMEARRPGPSYTVETLRELRRDQPHTRWVLLLGEDSLRDIPTWREPDSLRSLATIAVASRAPSPGGRAAPARRVRRAAGVEWLRMPAIALSSTELRACAARGESLRYRVPDAVERYIRAQRLYRKAGA